MSILKEFEKQLLTDCETYQQYFGKYPIGKDMIIRYGAIEAAKRLIKSTKIQQGFKRLMQYGHEGKQITMENRILEPRFSVLFDQETLNYARFRIENWMSL